MVYAEIKSLKKRLSQYSESEKKFNQKIFGGKESLYPERPNAKTKEDEHKEQQAFFEQAKIEKKNQEIREEAEYLETVNNL